ncbi:unnamed protein product [Caenorhabditis nigoni]
MSRFLEIPKSALSLTCLYNETVNYILQELRPSLVSFADAFGGPNDKRDGKEEAFIQLSIDKSSDKLRMYGSAQELLENVKIYKDFPANYKLFGTTPDSYQTRPRIFESFKNEKYIAKSDLFVVLHNMIYDPINHKLKKTVAMQVLRFFLQSLEKKLLGYSTEFTKFDEKRFEEMWKFVDNESGTSSFQDAEFPQLLIEFSKLSMPEIIEKFNGILYTLDADQQFVFESILEGCFPIEEEPWEELTSCYLDCKNYIGIFKTIIDENPDMFLPRGEDSEQPITVRVFEDGDQRFVMKSEIFDTKLERPHILETISMEKLFENHESHTQNVEFIRYPITRAKHRATPIQGDSGNFCVLAIDFFFEFLRELIHGRRVFQLLNPIDVPLFLQKMNGFDDIFYETETPYFLELDTTLQGDTDFIVNRPDNDVRNPKEDGFTVQDLKNELVHLGLTTTFPEIQDYAEAVYAEVDKHKKESVLRACDLFDAVEQCQLNCILERLPKLKKFVHSQKGCYRVYGLKCEDCAAENSKNQEGQKLSILEKELADLKITHQKLLDENQQKSLEIQELQQKNLRLSVKNESNEVKIKQLTEKLSQSKLSIDDGNYSNICTSQQKIQCLICEKSIESGQDQIIRCPLCKRRFHAKCAINWLKEHQQCPACNGDLPKF